MKFRILKRWLNFSLYHFFFFSQNPKLDYVSGHFFLISQYATDDHAVSMHWFHIIYTHSCFSFVVNLDSELHVYLTYSTCHKQKLWQVIIVCLCILNVYGFIDFVLKLFILKSHYATKTWLSSNRSLIGSKCGWKLCLICES